MMANRTRVLSGTMGPAPPMVGRTAERVLLQEHLEAMRAGHGTVVIVGGEAGIGKTTIARDLVTQARASGALTIVGHCHDLMAASPYGLWMDLAENYLHADADLPPLPATFANRELDAITSQSALFADVAACLRSLATTHPTVIVLEDVHWADPASLELLRYVSTRIDHLPLLLVVTYRIDELTRQNPFYQQLPALIHESEGLRLDLKRLGRHDLDTLASVNYPLPGADGERLVDYLVTFSEGNPFFAMELLRTLEEQEDGGLVHDGDGWQLGPIDHLRVPPLVRQVIDARIARLGEEVRAPLTIASVIGAEVPLDLLAEIAGMDEDTLYPAIDTAIEWHLCVASQDGARIRFVHALTREALYAAIPLHRRRALHRRIAGTLETRPRPDADAIAYHLQQAGDPRAPEWLTRAGERAQRAYAWLTARDRFAAAASLLEDVPGEELTRARLLYRCGRLQRYSNAREAIESLRIAAHLAQVAGDRVLAADATYSQGLVQCFADDWQQGLATLTRGIDGLLALPSSDAWIPRSTATLMADSLPTIEAWSASHPSAAHDSLVAIGPNRHMSLAWFLAASGRVIESQHVADLYRDVGSSEGSGPLAVANIGHAAFGRGISLATLGEPAAAREALRDARRSYLDIDHHACLAFTLLTELTDVIVPYRSDDPPARRAIANEAAAEIELSRGALTTEALPELAQLTVLSLDGRWSEARAIAEQCTNPGNYLLRRQLTLALAPIAYHTGDTETAWWHVRAILPDGPDAEPGSAVLHDALMLQRLAVDLCIDAGALDEAARWLDASDHWLQWSGSVPGRAETALGRARLVLAQGDVDAASTWADRAVRAASEPRQPSALVQALRLRGALSSNEEDLNASLELATACEIPYERAESLAALAALRRETDPAAAATLAQEARAVAMRLGAGPLTGRVERLLAEIEAASAAPRLPAGLTLREVEVLRLVAGGLTDAEVADRLSISRRTVGQHLRSVYNKLDVRSRTEATRFAIEHTLV
jgi:DNA-binding CsgD family transcriptional regulator